MYSIFQSGCSTKSEVYNSRTVPARQWKTSTAHLHNRSVQPLPTLLHTADLLPEGINLAVQLP